MIRDARARTNDERRRAVSRQHADRPPPESLDGLNPELEREFALSFVERADTTRISGSPVEIKAASEWLTRQGVAVP